jgi:hypothetical protein
MKLSLKSVKLHLASLLALAIFPQPSAALSAQEFRGSITGQVLDASGAAVAAAQVTATNTATGVATATSTNEEGVYTLLYLTPGAYSLTVEAAGFKRLVRQPVEVRVGDKLTLDLVLEVGAVQEVLNVTSDAPLLDSATASAGQVVDRRRISELPLSDGNPFVLARLAPGVAYTGDLLFSRPFDNSGTSSLVTDGAAGGNEFTLDGTPNQAVNRRVAFVPPADAVQEFKVETASFDAQQGHTAGANINVTTRSGTNDWHGTLYEFVRNDILSANDLFLNAAGRFTDDPNASEPDVVVPPGDARVGRAREPRRSLRYNRYGATIGGPVHLPRLYEGRKGLSSSSPSRGSRTRSPSRASSPSRP